MMYKNKSLLIVILFLSLSACSIKPSSTKPTAFPYTTTSPDEPTIITGTIPFTSPFFINTISEPFVLLEDEAGFVRRDREFRFPLESQVIGPVEIIDDQTLSYTLTLPEVPKGTLLDLDNNDQDDIGVMVFAVAYWSNTWGGPFLEPRDGTGWSNAYTSAITDPEREDEIQGGKLIAWAPDDQQSFPTGFGEDELLFTEDDPVASIPAGYSIVDLDQEPFRIYKEAQPEIVLTEGVVAVTDYSAMSYDEAFDALFEKATLEYPFTKDKGINWDDIYATFAPRVAQARNDDDFYRALRDFTYAIPDAHVGISFNAEIFMKEQGGGFGMVLTELSDGRVIVTHMMPDSPASDALIPFGAEILTWNGEPVSVAIERVQPYFGPYSTDHHRRKDQLIFLTRTLPGTSLNLTLQKPGSRFVDEVNMISVLEYDSLFLAMQPLTLDELSLPLQGEVLDGSGLGYIRITTFSGDYNLMARLWDHFISGLIDNDVPGLIIDIRVNSGGNGDLALDFAGYFFDEEIVLSQRSYYSERSGQFEYLDVPSRIEPGPLFYEGLIAVLIGPDCISACEGYAYALTQGGRSIVVGHSPSAGAYGEVGQGQYELPGGISLQFPTGRPETPDGQLLIEGVGVIPDILVPITEEDALSKEDSVLQTAIDALQDQIR
jgi:C-terminal processing protease CtpA/Prc